MTLVLYLILGLGLVFLLRKERSHPRDMRPLRFVAEACGSFLVLNGFVDYLGARFLWQPLGREDYRWLCLALGAAVLSEIRNRGQRRKETGVDSFFLVTLLAMSLATSVKGVALPLLDEGLLVRLGLGMSLILGLTVTFWILKGHQERLQLSQIPRIFEGEPTLFWTASILALTLSFLR